ncbi:MAG: hypothetical protein JWP57_280 [Spirosoma sp.]|nr:hypothetical protein [Spirosoma sp.]
MPLSSNGETPSGRRKTKTPSQAAPSPATEVNNALNGFIYRNPWLTIGSLTGLLIIVLAFKLLYQDKSWKAKRMAEEAYFVANQYARNNTVQLQPYLSGAFRREVRQLPGLLPLSMQAATRGGSISEAESVSVREISADSVVVELSIGFENGRREKRYQPMVFEKSQWRLGLTYTQ